MFYSSGGPKGGNQELGHFPLTIPPWGGRVGLRGYWRRQVKGENHFKCTFFLIRCMFGCCKFLTLRKLFLSVCSYFSKCFHRRKRAWGLLIRHFTDVTLRVQVLKQGKINMNRNTEFHLESLHGGFFFFNIEVQSLHELVL